MVGVLQETGTRTGSDVTGGARMLGPAAPGQGGGLSSLWPGLSSVAPQTSGTSTILALPNFQNECGQRPALQKEVMAMWA